MKNAFKEAVVAWFEDVADGHAFRGGAALAGKGAVTRLEHGVPVRVLDPLPAATPSVPSEDPVGALMALCGERARGIVARARAEKRGIRMLWSGGIDSTAAACALLRAADPATDRLSFFHGRRARDEHPRFLAERLADRSRTRIRHVRDALGTDDLVVTGEHGDQLFGSAKALDVGWDALAAPWREAFPRELGRRLASARRVDAALDWLGPQISRAPVPVETLWDLLWWLSFSLKWQSVTLRVPAQLRPDPKRGRGPLEQLALTEHFFRTDGFQRWALAHREAAIRPGDWTSYKWPLKRVVHRHDGDDEYLVSKRKVASLGDVTRGGSRRRCLAVTADGRALTQPLDTTLRDGDGRRAGGGPDAAEIEFDAGREAGLWDRIDASGE